MRRRLLHRERQAHLDCPECSHMAFVVAVVQQAMWCLADPKWTTAVQAFMTENDSLAAHGLALLQGSPKRPQRSQPLKQDFQDKDNSKGRAVTGPWTPPREVAFSALHKMDPADFKMPCILYFPNSFWERAPSGRCWSVHQALPLPTAVLFSPRSAWAVPELVWCRASYMTLTGLVVCLSHM